MMRPTDQPPRGNRLVSVAITVALVSPAVLAVIAVVVEPVLGSAPTTMFVAVFGGLAGAAVFRLLKLSDSGRR